MRNILLLPLVNRQYIFVYDAYLLYICVRDVIILCFLFVLIIIMYLYSASIQLPAQERFYE